MTGSKDVNGCIRTRGWTGALVAIVAVATALILTPVAGHAQDAVDANDSAPIALEQTTQGDAEIRRRLLAIFDEIDSLSQVTVWVREGVVVLSGKVANDNGAARAVRLAQRVQGAVEVEDEIDRTLSVEDNLNPLIERTEDAIGTVSRAWPLYAIAVAAMIVTAFAGHLIASAGRFWRWVAPNPFIARLIAQSIRIVSFLGGILLALSIVDAMALFGAAAGGAGLVGLAVGFAVKDTIENYIASVMLSLRQPFRADDHVVINDMEGVVVRLTSRATILMTLDGNHLRIPNAEVFKGVILNYTTNPQRRLNFKLGVDANDDPIEAFQSGLEALNGLEFILPVPHALAYIEEVGDSNIVLGFSAWVDQRDTDFLKARSAAINVVKTRLEQKGFTLPEPIYRVRLEGAAGLADSLRTGDAGTGGAAAADVSGPGPGTVTGGASNRQHGAPDSPAATSAEIAESVDVDVTPENDVRRQAAEDRAAGGTEDLLSDKRPIE